MKEARGLPKAGRASGSSGPSEGRISRLTTTRNGRREGKFADKSKRY